MLTNYGRVLDFQRSDDHSYYPETSIMQSLTPSAGETITGILAKAHVRNKPHFTQDDQSSNMQHSHLLPVFRL